MCYRLRNGVGETSPFSSGVFINEFGESTYLSSTDFDLEATGEWTSPRSGAVYPSGWKLSVPRVLLDLTIAPVLEDQELDTRGTTMIVYWEGACDVKGTAAENEVEGKAYVELVGYDRSHDQPNLARFLLGDTFESLTKWFAG